ncbi:predicted protein [Naegleria gruberi]|uniref:Predicted protein n=1 Tax=Naegleria gruberi TaxID=5762 RepID=D2W0A8_NAEGR|nr:uncharacterized protein NAEGRDRAFT_53681 [Naegleria gruberi]EFC37542.1 predicted protein [Naegleria gruberi]|eukprot:XP_002670286.1 predicted protein [Naegleria gruberi strain NEG-M]
MLTDTAFEKLYQSGNDASSTSNVISSISWVPKGAFKLIPTILADSMTEPPKDPKEQQDDDDEDNEMEDSEMNDDEQVEEEETSKIGGLEEISLEELLYKSVGGKNLTMYENNEQDPYLKGRGLSDSSEEEDFELKATDLPLVAIHNEEDGLTTLQVWIYEQEEDNLFMHHDLLLGNYGLCTHWLNLSSISQPSNCIAIGTFEPQIEIWDLDIVDPIEPVMILGNETDSKKKKSQSMGHKGAILSMSFRSSDSKLASGSDDKSIVIWDLSNQKPFYQVKGAGASPIQSVQFHHTEQNILLACPISDHVCKVFDAKQQNSKPKSFNLQKFNNVFPDIESAIWNPNNPYEFVCAQDNGFITCFDIRNEKTPVYNINAHSGASCSSISFSNLKSNLMASVGSDSCVRLWNTKTSTPELVYTKNVKKSMSDIYSCAFAPSTLNDDIILAYGGSGGNLSVLNISLLTSQSYN